VSIATYNQVAFPHPQDGVSMLVLERKASLEENGSTYVRAQPFGGGVRILDAAPLQELIGEIRYDSERSQRDQDFRILIQPSQWPMVKDYVLDHLGDSNDLDVEASPDRELVEEFEETLQVELKPTQYEVQPLGFVLEETPVWTRNWYARGFMTVRIYRTFRAHITDGGLCEALLSASQGHSDHDLGQLALMDSQKGGRGRANSVLTLPLRRVTESYLALPPEERYRKITVDNHRLDESVLVILPEVDVPQYQRSI
jgi:hypothetical protein